MFSREFLIQTALYLAFAVPLSIMDARKLRISLALTFAGTAAFICYRFFGACITGFSASKILFVSKAILVSAATSAFVLFITRILSGNGLGMGDIFYGIFTSLYALFFTNIAGILFAALIGILFYLFLAVLDRIKKNEKVLRPIFAIPFVPFLSAGAILAKIFFS